MSQPFAPLDRFTQEKMSETLLPGVALALLRDGRVVYERGFGARDLERGLPVTPRTRFGVGSVTKSFTSLALLQLQEAGRLSIDDPVERYLPLPLRTPGDEPLRLRHLMTHTSGLPALAYAEAVIRHHVGATTRWVPMRGEADLLAFLDGAGDWIVTQPGERWFYLNEGYLALGAVIERVSGLAYPDYIREHILVPLRMTRSGFRAEDVAGDLDVAVPYVIDREKRQVASQYLFGLTADGGLVSCVEDLAGYVAMFLAEGQGPEGPIVSPGLLREMWRPRIPTPFVRPGPRGPEPAEFYGLGLAADPDFFGETLVGHGGGVLVFTAYIGFVPSRGVGVALLANGSGYPLNQIGAFALAVLLGKDPWSIPAIRVEQVLDGLTGTYETYRGTMRALVRRGGSYLTFEVQETPQPVTVVLVPAGLDVGALDPDHPRFVSLAGARQLPVEFIRRDGGVDLIYERYRLRRVGKA